LLKNGRFGPPGGRIDFERLIDCVYSTAGVTLQTVLTQPFETSHTTCKERNESSGAPHNPHRASARAAVDHLCTIRSRPHMFANIRTSGPICRDGPLPFAVVWRGRLCKQGVVGRVPSSPPSVIRTFGDIDPLPANGNTPFMHHPRPPTSEKAVRR
jgi:hypothetical protein